MTSNKNESSVFIIPHYETPQEKYSKTNEIKETIAGLFSQTDNDWCAIIVVDKFHNHDTHNYLSKLKAEYFPKIDVIFLEQNVGPGISRNIGILRGIQRKCSLILFNDSDDISHPERLKVVKKIFDENQETDVVYSTFDVIDENNQLTPIEKISTPILEILESHLKPLEGNDIWIRMGTETGYTNITSSTAVRIGFAYRCPFPNEITSEDFHCWMRMSAFGATFKYTSLIPTKYRIPSFYKYQSSRMRIGLRNFNRIKTRVDSDAFFKSIEIGVMRNIIRPEEVPMLKAKFYKRLAKSMKRIREDELANDLLNKAIQMNKESVLYSEGFFGND